MCTIPTVRQVFEFICLLVMKTTEETHLVIAGLWEYGEGIDFREGYEVNCLVNLENGEKKWMTMDENSKFRKSSFFKLLGLAKPPLFAWLIFVVHPGRLRVQSQSESSAWLCHKSVGKNGVVPYQLEECAQKKKTASLLHPPKKMNECPPFTIFETFHLPSISRGLHSLTIRESIILTNSLLKLAITASLNHPCFIFQPSHVWKARLMIEKWGVISILEISNHEWRCTLR